MHGDALLLFWRPESACHPQQCSPGRLVMISGWLSSCLICRLMHNNVDVSSCYPYAQVQLQRISSTRHHKPRDDGDVSEIGRPYCARMYSREGAVPSLETTIIGKQHLPLGLYYGQSYHHHCCCGASGNHRQIILNSGAGTASKAFIAIPHDICTCRCWTTGHHMIGVSPFVF